jgi:hypothetical protein
MLITVINTSAQWMFELIIVDEAGARSGYNFDMDTPITEQ